MDVPRLQSCEHRGGSLVSDQLTIGPEPPAPPGPVVAYLEAFAAYFVGRGDKLTKLDQLRCRTAAEFFATTIANHRAELDSRT